MFLWVCLSPLSRGGLWPHQCLLRFYTCYHTHLLLTLKMHFIPQWQGMVQYHFKLRFDIVLSKQRKIRLWRPSANSRSVGLLAVGVGLCCMASSLLPSGQATQSMPPLRASPWFAQSLHGQSNDILQQICGQQSVWRSRLRIQHLLCALCHVVQSTSRNLYFILCFSV